MRTEANFGEIQVALDALRSTLQRRLDQHGKGKFCSTHEGLGVITEEYHELVDAVQSNEPSDYKSECLDVAVAAFWAYLSAPSSLD